MRRLLAAILLLGMGYDILSMNSTSLGRVKKSLRAISSDDARSVLEEVMAMDDADQVHRRLEQFGSDRGLGQFIHARLD